MKNSIFYTLIILTMCCAGLAIAGTHPGVNQAHRSLTEAGTGQIGPIAIRESAPNSGVTLPYVSDVILQGGDDFASATIIPGLPFTDNGTTIGFGSDYASSCVYTNLAPDVVYSYTPASNDTINVSLCPGFGWDTGLFVYQNDVTGEVGCNNDYCEGTSQIDNLPVLAGNIYYIVITGVHGDSGDYTLTVVETPPPPPNDNCVDVTPSPLTAGAPLTFTGDNTGATRDCPLLSEAEVWHAFTTAETLDVVIDYCGTPSGWNTYFWELTDGCPCGMTIIRTWADWNMCGDNNLTFGFDRLPPGTYYLPVAMSPMYGSVGPYTVHVNGAVPPPYPVNDNCGDVTPVPLNIGGAIAFSGTNSGCTMDCPDGGYAEVWHAITTTECTDITIDYCGTTGPWGMVFEFITDACPCGNFIYANNWDLTSCPDGNFTLHWINVPAGTYYIPVMYNRDFGAVGPYTLNVASSACLPPPANDNCANAEPVGEVTDQPFSTTRATFDGAGMCMNSNNIWYLYTAPVSGPTTVSLCGSLFNTQLAIYDGATCPVAVVPPAPVPLQGGESFDFAVPITNPLPVSYTGTTAGHINEIVGNCVGAIAPDVVYSFVPPTNMIVDIELCGSTYNTGLMVFDYTFMEVDCNDDMCGTQSALYGLYLEAGLTYYIVVDGFGEESGNYTLTMNGIADNLLDCNDDFCRSGSQIIFDAIGGNQYLIEVGGSRLSCGDGDLTISLPPAHDVAATAFVNPRAGALLDGVTPVPITATVSNFGLYPETFDVTVSDDQGFSSTFTGQTLNPGESIDVTFPDMYTPTITCIDYYLEVRTSMTGDLAPENDAMYSSVRVPRTSDQTFQHDDGVVANSWNMFDESNLIATQYTATTDKEIAYLGARTYVDELGYPSPDYTADPFRLCLFLDSDLNGIPDDYPVSEAIVVPTGIAPSYSYGVLECGIAVTAGQNFWVAFGNINDTYGEENIAMDAATDFPNQKWYMLNGTWTQGEQYPGDEMLYAFATSEVSGCAYVPGDINGNGQTNGIDVGYGVNYFKGGSIPPIQCDMCPQPQPFYAAGDVNGNCTFNGIDVTFFVNYLKGIVPAILYCPDCPPAPTMRAMPASSNTPVEEAVKNEKGDIQKGNNK